MGEPCRTFHQIYARTMSGLYKEGFITLSRSSADIAALRDALPEDCVRIYDIKAAYRFKSPRQDIGVTGILALAHYLYKSKGKTLRAAIREVVFMSEADLATLRVAVKLSSGGDTD